MSSACGVDAPTDRSAGPDHWPAQVELILSALETGQHGHGPSSHRRALRRRPYRVRACLRLFSDPMENPPWVLYTRDASARGIGFITAHRLPLGYGGTVELPLAPDRTLRVQCTLHRCRQTAPGWYEGALHFNREQHLFGME